MAATAVPSPMVQVQSAAAMGVVAAAPPSNPAAMAGVVLIPNSSLYVGDLDATVDESKLYDLFSQVAPVVSVRVCRDQNRRASLGYAYVNFNTPMDAVNARDLLNFTHVNGKPIRIMFSHRDPSLRKSGYANLFIKNLDPSIDNKALYETFSAFGIVLSCKVAVDNNAKSKGYGFVQFDKEEAAQNAIKRLNGMLMNDKQVYVGNFVHRRERNGSKGSPIFKNVYVKNLSESTTDESLRKLFEKFGPITSAVIMKDENGKSRCFGFVNFENPDSAASAVENLNGSSLDEKVLYVGRAEKKTEREAELRARFEQERINRFEKLKGANLYLKNLHDSIDDEKMKELFAEFGTITSCKLIRDPSGVSKGAGFVAFSNPEEANKALNEMNGKMVGGKPLYVAVAQRKEERKNWLQFHNLIILSVQTHFAQMRSPGTMSPMPGMSPMSGMPGFHTGANRLAHQQLYFGQVGHGLVPQAPAAYGFQQQHLSGLPPGVPSNFVMPFQFQRQTQPVQRLGARRGANSQQQHQQQINSNPGVGRYTANGRNNVNPSMVPLSVPLSRSTLASALASASPENQRIMLGEQLYPLVERVERNHAGKVTGMLLEMDQTEVLHLIESPDALKKKVSEALDVLRLAASGSDGD
ncbi:polyadenylate-binding protein 3 [Phtheirospermum japonicum]|uniref:Polyadenylate-binding protein n=1 Tax=Phtheirospermum japonicum TaxID=374723 RepID=A0A830CH74_9LAMI|nr:polyadenylate-binding protein 3 [Phtheirospermum japonicum]